MSMPSSLIKKYVSNNVPQEDLQHAMHKWIKRYWKSLSAKGRTQLRVDLQNHRPIFADIPVTVRSADSAIILDWSKPSKKINRRKHGRCISWKRYCSKNKIFGALKRKEIEEKPSSSTLPLETMPVGKKVLTKKKNTKVATVKRTKKNTKTAGAEKTKKKTMKIGNRNDK
jgi:hypothetical protein